MPPPGPQRPTYSIQTSAAAAGAVAVIQVAAPDVNALLARLGMAPVALGQVKVRDLLGVDRGVVARWQHGSVHLMPHGGVGVLRALAARLEAAGVSREEMEAPYPEARTPIEVRMLAALARAASPLAIDLLLDQPRRWSADPDAPLRGVHRSQSDLTLRLLLEPPLVVGLGPPNVGKSTLLNILAGRSVAAVADEPGTTRDHVGVMLNLGGLAVRYVDAPGLRDNAGEIEQEAQSLAMSLAAGADLTLLLGDAGSPPPGGLGVDALTVAMRADLGKPAWPFDAAVSALDGTGIPALVAAIRDRLVPPAALTDPRPWVFWA